MARFRKMLVAGTAIVAGLGWAGPSVLAKPGHDVVAITGATIFDATGRAPFRGTVIVRGGRIEAVGADVKV
ncbi:MAG TPA: amidohydrolase, partial [Sphingopyxis sp.]|nr:amidohydrolase [Sphingopyxis sp.]